MRPESPKQNRARRGLEVETGLAQDVGGISGADVALGTDEPIQEKQRVLLTSPHSTFSTSPRLMHLTADASNMPQRD